MMLFLFSCLPPNLAGDSVYPNSPTSDVSIPEPTEGSIENGSDQLDYMLYNLTFTEDTTDTESAIDVTVETDIISVVHSYVQLSCDMSQYNEEISIEDMDITIYYMPLQEERDCFYDVEFSFDRPFEPGRYILTLMEDQAEFIID